MDKTAVVATSLASLVLQLVGAVADGRSFVVDSERSEVMIHVGRAGLLGFVGHSHEVLAPLFSGEIRASAEDLAASTVSLRFEAAALRVTGKGEPAEDVPEVQERMLGPDVLAVGRFPEIVFRSTRVEGRELERGVYELKVSGEVGLHGVTRSIMVPVRVEMSGDLLQAKGRLTLVQRDFGMTPVSVAGVVKVKDELAIDFTIVARSSVSVSATPRP